MATVLEQLACEVPSESAPTATLKAPFRAILGFSAHESVYFYSWITILAIYLILYFAMPLNALNSYNGFKSGSVVLVSSLVIFAIVVMAYVVWNRSAACASKRTKALYYLKGIRAEPPRGFEAAIARAADIKQSPETADWKPLKSTVKRPAKLPF